jgi:outer membrane protein OmpA-like peptidoglycan-associated protein
MSKAACKCKEVECEECPEWIFTLADLIMCMMGLFVILWVLKTSGMGNENMSAADKQALNEVIAAIRESFGYVPDAASTDPIDTIILNRLRQLRALNGPGKGAESYVPRSGTDGTDPEVLSPRKGNEATVGSRVLFAPGSAALDGEARRILDDIAKLIRGHRNVMYVRGHTSLDDTREGATAQEKMDLSLKRAQVVVEYLVTSGIDPDVLRPVGCSVFEPVIQRAYSTPLQQQNRRVEVEATHALVADLQDRPEPARPAQSRPAAGGGTSEHR